MDESCLIKKAILGETSALEALIGEYYDAIYAYCCRRMGSSAQGADLCQETFLKVVESLPGYRDKGRFRSWLFTIANNCCRDAYRRLQRQNALVLPEPTGERFEELSENGELLRSALNELPDAQREAVILRFYHDFTLREIARITGVLLPTAKARLQRGLARLKILLKEEISLEE